MTSIMNTRRRILVFFFAIAFGLTILVTRLNNSFQAGKTSSDGISGPQVESDLDQLLQTTLSETYDGTPLEPTEDMVSDNEFKTLIERSFKGPVWSGILGRNNTVFYEGNTTNQTNAIIMKPTVSARRYDRQVVPNIVHYIWFGTRRRFEFLYYLSILSVYMIQRPEAIMFHHNAMPNGWWWDSLRKRVPLTLVYRSPPPTVFNQNLNTSDPYTPYHQGDLAKLEVLMEHGGIYIDLDVLVLKNFQPLFHYDMTLGKEHLPKFIAGIIIARKNAHFLHLWYESYKDNYMNDLWDYNCGNVPYFLYCVHPSLLHVEPRRLTTPDWLDRHLLVEEVIDWREQGLYVLHAMSHAWSDRLTPQNIQPQNSTLTQAAWFIYSMSES